MQLIGWVTKYTECFFRLTACFLFSPLFLKLGVPSALSFQVSKLETSGGKKQNSKNRTFYFCRCLNALPNISLFLHCLSGFFVKTPRTHPVLFCFWQKCKIGLLLFCVSMRRNIFTKLVVWKVTNKTFILYRKLISNIIRSNSLEL